MKERPILFSAPMVCAILEGRKTQTRRALNPQPAGGHQQGVIGPLNSIGNLLICKHGSPGDRLWVRETFCWSGYASDPEEVLYRADEEYTLEDRGDLPWKPSIFMPRWASRISLEITVVRVERLIDISATDAIAEGARRTADGGAWHIENEQHRSADPRDTFASLWESINGAGSWEQNPWVWVIEFKRIQEAA